MKNKIMILGTILMVSLLLLTPTINAINNKIKNETIDEKIEKYQNILDEKSELNKLIKNKWTPPKWLENERLLGLFMLLGTIYALFIWHFPLSPFFWAAVYFDLMESLETGEPFLKVYFSNSLEHILLGIWCIIEGIYLIIFGDFFPYNPPSWGEIDF